MKITTFLDQNYGILYCGRNIVSKFALWIDGVCYGVFSRVRDALRKYRSLFPEHTIGINRNWLPAWVENLDGKLVKRIVGSFPFAV